MLPPRLTTEQPGRIRSPAAVMYGADRDPLSTRAPVAPADTTGMAVTVIGFPSWRCNRAWARDLPEGGPPAGADTSRRKFIRFCLGPPRRPDDCYEAVTSMGRSNTRLTGLTRGVIHD